MYLVYFLELLSSETKQIIEKSRELLSSESTKVHATSVGATVLSSGSNFRQYRKSALGVDTVLF